jgi:hypothetical protein
MTRRGGPAGPPQLIAFAGSICGEHSGRASDRRSVMGPGVM